MNKHISIRRPIRSDIEYLSEHIRDDDRLELKAMGLEPLEALEYVFSDSVCDDYTALCDGIPIAMFGTHKESPIGVTATIWMLGTSGVAKYPIELIKMSREVVSRSLLENVELMNYIDCRYKKTLRWLKHLGFSFGEPFKLGVNGEEFIKASIRR